MSDKLRNRLEIILLIITIVGFGINHYQWRNDHQVKITELQLKIAEFMEKSEEKDK